MKGTEMVQYTRLTRPEIRAFDKDAKKLILDATERGWLGTISSAGHAIMRAPDGETTMSVSRASMNGRSGKNQWAEYERWCRDHPEADPKPKPVPHDPWVTCPDCKNLFVSQEDLEEHKREAHSESIKARVEDEVVETLARATAGITKIGDIEAVETSVPTVEFPCEVCGQAFASAQARGAHMKVHRESEVCHQCGKTVRYMRTHMEREHGEFQQAVSYVQTLLADLWRLTEENHKLRTERGSEAEDLRAQLAAMTQERDDLAAKFAIIKEAAGL